MCFATMKPMSPKRQRRAKANRILQQGSCVHSGLAYGQQVTCTPGIRVTIGWFERSEVNRRVAILRCCRSNGTENTLKASSGCFLYRLGWVSERPKVTVLDRIGQREGISTQ